MCTCEMSKFSQGYQNRSCGCVILTTPAELKKTTFDLSCLPECNCHNFPITSPESEMPQCTCPLSACLFNIMRICVHVCLLYVCPTCVPLSQCVFCNLRKTVSELAAMTHEETGSLEQGQQDALADFITTPADMDM